MNQKLFALDYAKMAYDTLIKKFTPEELPPAIHFHYHQGVFLSGLQRCYMLSGDEKYYDCHSKYFLCNSF